MRTRGSYRRLLRDARTLALVCVAWVAIGRGALPAWAQSGGSYDLSWWTVDGGGGTSSNTGVYTLSGTAGQPDVGAAEGGGYRLEGGFWGGGVVRYDIFLPLVLRNN